MMVDATWPLDRQGFICHYLVSGPQVTPFFSEEKDPNQLRYEANLRKRIPRHLPVENAAAVDCAAPGRLGLPWRFQGGQDCAFINLSDFYATMQRVAFDAVTVLVSPSGGTVAVRLWSYAAVDVYCNGALVGSLASPVYKPIGHLDLALPLSPGKNVLYLACETLGVRDTRSVVGLQLINPPSGLRVTLPDGTLAAEAVKKLAFLEHLTLESDSVRFPSPAPAGAQWTDHTESEDFAHIHDPVLWRDLSGQTELQLAPGSPSVTLRVPLGPDFLTRALERTEQIRPLRVTPTPSPEENLRLIWRRIADVESLARGEDFGFPIANILARKYLNDTSRDDDALLAETLRLIDARVDCADFLVCGLIRYLKVYGMPETLSDRVRQVLTHWRYWMDQDGFDGMCYWSENHCLMFYSSAMLAGEMFPEDSFPLAKRTGRELSHWGRGKVLEWLEDVETCGFEEFLSTVYTCVTFAALINVVDFAEPEIAWRATAITDRMLEMLALHTWKGGIIAPQGRVYRGVLYPFRAGAMALMNLADPAQPYDYGEGWLGFYATSRYRFPAGLKARMDQPASLSYVTGNARIVLEKREDWCLTSVQCPREPFSRWENGIHRLDADPSSHAFVKSYNECFHGTTCFQPGVYGYQQHLWYAALDGAAVLFTNHPGSSSEGGDMRPGYWHGSGVFPAQKQEGNLLGQIWRIPENHPFHYIHLYAPECRFDEVRRMDASGGREWMLFRKGNGFLGFWASVPLEPWNNRVFRCEQRMWGSEIACLCVCAGKEMADLDAFARSVRALSPRYDPETSSLTAGPLALTWIPGQDDTQYL